MRSIVLLAGAVMVSLLFVGPAAAQYPSTMNYQMMLTDDTDQPLADQAVELVFRLYTTESGGTAVWTETHNTTTNGIGVVSVVLGDSDPLPFMDWLGITWLEIEVDGQVMSPRRQLTAAPYAFMTFDTMRFGGASPSEFATDEELSASGTINTPSNPVDWTMLKNVPSGIADGTDDEGGAGDGHSLDAWDGDPVDAVWVGGNGRVGIGTTEPTATLHVHRDTLNSVSLRLTTEESGTTTTDGLGISLMPFGGSAAITNYEGAPLYLGSGYYSQLVIRSDGSVEVCPDLSRAGELKVYGTTSSGFALHRSFVDAEGGQFELKDEVGNVAVLYGADANGTGGRLMVQRNDVFGYDDGIDLNGNWSGTEEPALRVLGSSNTVGFFMSSTGNSSVQLPGGSVSDVEILDEPGVAGTSTSADVVLSTGPNVVAAKSITVPSSGYVLAIASGQADIYHTGGSWDDIDIGISEDEANLPASQGMALTLPPAAMEGSYNFPLASHALFEVSSAGTYTYYYLARLFQGGSFEIDEANLSLVFLPTAYGTVVPTLPGEADAARDDGNFRPPLSPAEIEDERSRAPAFNLARVERELAEIRAQLAAMKE
jgi:hypothetical protein